MILLSEYECLSCQALTGPVKFQLPRESKLYTCAKEAGESLVVPDMLTNDRSCADPLVVAGPHVRFYAAFPLRGGAVQPLSRLYLFDGQPRELKVAQRGALRLIGRQLGEWFEARCLSGTAARGNTQRQQLMRSLKRG